MSQEDKLVRIRQKTDTAEGWLASNPILLYGELGIEIDTQLIKIGDGVTPWSGLPYVLADQIMDLVDNKVLGACGLCYIDWINRNADFSIYIGDKNVSIFSLFI